MANPHPNEQELYERIRQEDIKVPLGIWDMIYRYIGDDVTAITQIVFSYSRYHEPIAIEDARKILDHTRRINTAVGKILHPERIGDEEEEKDFERLKKDNIQLHPVIKELFTHYIGNDVFGINMIVGFYLDPKGEEPIPPEDAQKILDKTATMKQFMDRLSEVTNHEIRSTFKNEE